MLTIRQANMADLPRVMPLFERAKAFMRAHGNATQWVNGYPSEALMRGEIEAGHCFVCEDEEGDAVGTFCYIEGVDPTYLKIYDGSWLNDEPYGVVHRLASSGKRPGIGEACFRWAFRRRDNIRVDTHRDNIVMQRLLAKLGFSRRGIIYLANGSERIAYHWTRAIDN